MCRASPQISTSPEASPDDATRDSGFRKLSKIESGSSVARGNLLDIARARASLALEPEEAESELSESPLRL